MKNFVFILSFILLTAGIEGKSVGSSRSYCQVDSILVTYNRLEGFEKEFLTEESYEDSIFSANSNLIRLFLKFDRFSLHDSIIEQIEAGSKISFAISEDRKCICVSWPVFNSYPTPMFSRIIFYEGQKKVLSQNGTGDNDFGENVDAYKVTLATNKGQTHCILLGSNKCGNICVRELAEAYLLGSDIEESPLFFDGKRNVSRIEFDYLLNDHLDLLTSFEISNNTLLLPLFNFSKTKKVGVRKIKMDLD